MACHGRPRHVPSPAPRRRHLVGLARDVTNQRSSDWLQWAELFVTSRPDPDVIGGPAEESGASWCNDDGQWRPHCLIFFRAALPLVFFASVKHVFALWCNKYQRNVGGD